MTSDKRTVILMQDECAPDALVTFLKEFEATFGESFNSFYNGAPNTAPDPEYGVELTVNFITASSDAGSPFWEVAAPADIAWRYLVIKEIKRNILNHIGWLEDDARKDTPDSVIKRINLIRDKLKTMRKDIYKNTYKNARDEKPNTEDTERVS